MGRSAASQAKSVSGDTAVAIDREVRKIIDGCYERATKILTDNRHLLDLMKDALMEYETIDQAQINDIMEGRKPRPPASWSDSNNSGSDSSSGSAEKQTTTEEKSNPIGGPASEH